MITAIPITIRVIIGFILVVVGALFALNNYNANYSVRCGDKVKRYGERS